MRYKCSEIVRNKYRVIFDTDGSYIEDKQTGERMNLTEKNGMYILKMWVKIPVDKMKGETMKVSEKEEEEVNEEENGEEISCPLAGQSW